MAFLEPRDVLERLMANFCAVRRSLFTVRIEGFCFLISAYGRFLKDYTTTLAKDTRRTVRIIFVGRELAERV